METECLGCGLWLPESGAPLARLSASDACWKLFGELSAYTISAGADFIHQHAVDTYQAQHAVRSASRIGIAFSLIGLCLAIERGATGLQVQRAHMYLGSAKKSWPELDPPRERAALTVRDVLEARPGDPRNAVLMQWAKAVWETWAHAHEWTRAACDDLLSASFSRRVRGR